MTFERSEQAGVRGARKFDHWPIARRLLAALFGVAGVAKLVAPFGGPPVIPAPVWIVLAMVEVSGGLLLLFPRFASFAAAVLVVASGVIALTVYLDHGVPVPWPVLLIVPALGAVGYVCRPGALTRARLEWAIDRFMEVQQLGVKGDNRG